MLERYPKYNDIFCVMESKDIPIDFLKSLTQKAQQFLQQPGFLFLTSGSTGQPKFVLHSWCSLEVCAKACGQCLELTPGDRWYNVLSPHHMGGFSTYMRTEVLGLRPVVTDAWSAEHLAQAMQEQACNLISLVPTQVYEIVEKNIKAPPKLKCTLVGGGALDKSIKSKAQSLGWRVLSSLGSTETGSQIFTDTFKNPEVGPLVLPHFEVQTNENNLLQIKGEGLFKAYITFKDYLNTDSIEIKPIEMDLKGFWTSSDRVLLKGNRVLKFLGRSTDQIKILGHLVDLLEVRHGLAELLKDNDQINLNLEDCFIDSLPDEKSENHLVIFTEAKNMTELKKLQSLWNSKAKPWQSLRGIYYLHKIPKSNVGKVQSEKIKETFLKPKL